MKNTNEANEDYRVCIFLCRDELKVSYVKFRNLEHQICFVQGCKLNDIQALWKCQSKKDAKRLRRIIKSRITRSYRLRKRSIEGYTFKLKGKIEIICSYHTLQHLCKRDYRWANKVNDIPSDFRKSKEKRNRHLLIMEILSLKQALAEATSPA